MKKIDLIDKKLRLRKNSKLHLWIISPLIVLCVVLFLFTQNIIFAEDGLLGDIASGITGITPEPTVEGPNILKDENRINVLMMGIGGLGHDGGLLTDTILLASVHTEKKEASLISIPRDLLVTIPDYGQQKVNHAYALTERDSPGSGGLVAKSVLSQVLGVEIDYYFVLDFPGFIGLIDELGGVNVYVENGFYDEKYPTDDHLYQTIEFEQGWQVMNGDRALKFARSRHGICTTACAFGEGSDFARSNRQQKIIKALKDKILSSKTLANPKNLFSILDSYQANVDTDIQLWDVIKYFKLAQDIDTSNIMSNTIDDSPNGYLKAGKVNGQYVLIPKDNTYQEIHYLVQNLFADEAEIRENAKTSVEIQNGTSIAGLAGLTAKELERKGIYVTKVSNAIYTDIDNTVIYDLTGGQKTASLKEIKSYLPNSRISFIIPEELLDEEINVADPEVPNKSKADFLIILGKDAQ